MRATHTFFVFPAPGSPICKTELGVHLPDGLAGLPDIPPLYLTGQFCNWRLLEDYRVPLAHDREMFLRAVVHPLVIKFVSVCPETERTAVQRTLQALGFVCTGNGDGGTPPSNHRLWCVSCELPILGHGHERYNLW